MIAGKILTASALRMNVSPFSPSGSGGAGNGRIVTVRLIAPRVARVAVDVQLVAHLEPPAPDELLLRIGHRSASS